MFSFLIVGLTAGLSLAQYSVLDNLEPDSVSWRRLSFESNSLFGKLKTVVSLSHAPEELAAIILGLSENPLILLFLINVLLFVVGMFLDAGPAIIILGPILGPIFVDLGVHPVHFAIIMSVNLTVGLATPPMGLVLFVASSVSGERVETISRAILPFLAVEVLVIFLITYVPAVSMTIPRLTGFVQ